MLLVIILPEIASSPIFLSLFGGDGEGGGDWTEGLFQVKKEACMDIEVS
jgi:hypothetical protein